MSKIETYRATARKALERGNRRHFLAMRSAECHVLLEQAKALPKRIPVGETEWIGSLPIRETVINEVRRQRIAAICARHHRINVMARRLEGAVVHMVDRCDGFYHLEARVPGFPSIDMSGKLADRSAAASWAQRNGFLLADEVVA